MYAMYTYIDQWWKRNVCGLHYIPCALYHISDHTKVHCYLVLFISLFYVHGQVVDNSLCILHANVHLSGVRMDCHFMAENLESLKG